MATVVYCVSPVDIVPDIAPLLGQLDDLGVILLEIRAFLEYLRIRREETQQKIDPPAGGK